jgi:hypothetical protein
MCRERCANSPRAFLMSEWSRSLPSPPHGEPNATAATKIPDELAPKNQFTRLLPLPTSSDIKAMAPRSHGSPGRAGWVESRRTYDGGRRALRTVNATPRRSEAPTAAPQFSISYRFACPTRAQSLGVAALPCSPALDFDARGSGAFGPVVASLGILECRLDRDGSMQCATTRSHRRMSRYQWPQLHTTTQLGIVL